MYIPCFSYYFFLRVLISRLVAQFIENMQFIMLLMLNIEIKKSVECLYDQVECFYPLDWKNFTLYIEHRGEKGERKWKGGEGWTRESGKCDYARRWVLQQGIRSSSHAGRVRVAGSRFPRESSPRSRAIRDLYGFTATFAVRFASPLSNLARGVP